MLLSYKFHSFNLGRGDGLHNFQDVTLLLIKQGVAEGSTTVQWCTKWGESFGRLVSKTNVKQKQDD